MLDQLNFRARPGVPLLITGPNGAGKSTLLRLVSGLVEFQEGTLQWTNGAGQSLEPEEARALFHYVGHLDAIKPSFTVGESLKFWADLYGSAAPIDEAVL